MKNVEILSPAGNMECFLAAINAGADAVYMAGKAYGARAEAGNFTEEEFVRALNIAHINGRKIYLTLNTLIKEREWKELHGFLTPLYEAGLDGVIIQDLGLVDYLSREFPKLPLHASTQMTITHPLSAKLLKENGIVRVVPARELSLEEIKNIKEEAGVEVEAFIHGAMCYCYSGQCLFSSFLGGRSGNRGRCAGTCRLPYSVSKTEDKKIISKDVYPLSLKDLCTIDHMGQLIDAGIDSFKIEGRLKSPEYVAGVTHIYRKYVDAHLRGESMAVSDKDRQMLENLYLRGNLSDGYYYRHNSKDMVSLTNPSYNKNNKGSEENIAFIKENFMEKATVKTIYGAAIFKAKENMSLTIYDDEGVSITVMGGPVEPANARPATKEDIIKRLNKTGGTGFVFETLDVQLEDNLFIPVGALNELRREGILAYENKLLEAYRREMPLKPADKAGLIFENVKQKENYSVSVMQAKQLKAVMDYEFENLYIPYDLFYSKQIDIEDISRDKKLILSLPRIIRKRDKKYLEALKDFLNKYAERIERVLVKNLEEIEFVKEVCENMDLEADHSIYTWNTHSLDFLLKYVKRTTAPLELSIHELKDIKYRDPVIPIYGNASLMVSANCIAKTGDKCTGDKYGFDYALIDRYKKNEGVFCNCIHCYNEIFNAMPTSLHNKLKDLKAGGFNNFRLDFTLEDESKIKDVLDYYLKGTKEAPFEFTSGHIDKGAI